MGGFQIGGFENKQHEAVQREANFQFAPPDTKVIWLPKNHVH
jgi:hypothetical protein